MPFDVMVMAFLWLADSGLEAEHLFAILAHLAIHQRLAFEYLRHAILEGVEHQRVVVEIRRLDEWISGCRAATSSVEE